MNSCHLALTTLASMSAFRDALICHHCCSHLKGVWLWHLAAQAADTMLPHVKVFQSFSKLLDEVAAIEEQVPHSPSPPASIDINV